MAATRPVLAVVLLALVCLSSCDSDKPTGSSGVILDPFPNAVGMLWKYEVFDSLTAMTDTVWVSVTDSTLTRCGFISYSWRQHWTTRDSVVNRYALAWVDSAMIDLVTDSTCEPMMLDRFVFPLVEGAVWTGPSIFDTCRVAETGTVTVPAGAFRNSALVEYTWDRDFEGGGNWTKTWLAPDVGIAHRHGFQTYSDGATITVLENRVWRLLEYDLRTFSLDQFPNTVGTEWVYELAESKLGTTLVDTITVTIIDTISISNRDSATVWEFVGDDYSDTMYVAVSGSDIFVTFDTLGVVPFLGWRYEFPMTVGSHWGFDFIVPVPIVNDKVAVVTPAGRFPTSFHYMAGAGGQLYISWVLNDWLVPGIGVVKRTFLKTYDGPPTIQEWTLLSFAAP